MPLIDIPERQTPAEVSLIVWSYMLHPENRDDAIEHFAKLWLLADSKIRNAPNDEVLSLPASFIKALIAGPSLDEMASTKQLRLRSGFTAGALLISMYITSALNHKISMSRAIHLVERSKL